MASIRYYLVDITTGNYTGLIRSLNALHKATHPKNNLGILYNNDLTRAVVKVVNDTRATSRLEHIITYEKVDHDQVLNLLYTDSNWMDDTKTKSQLTAINLLSTATSTDLLNAEI